MIYSIPDITAIEFPSLILHVHLENNKDSLAWFVLYSRKFIINVESVTFTCLLNSSQPWSLSWGIQVSCCYWHLLYSSSLYSQLERGKSRKIALWLQALLHINNNRTKQILIGKFAKRCLSKLAPPIHSEAISIAKFDVPDFSFNSTQGWCLRPFPWHSSLLLYTFWTLFSSCFSPQVRLICPDTPIGRLI